MYSMENEDYEAVAPQEFINGIVEKILEEHTKEISDINDNIEELDNKFEDLDNNSIKIVEMNEMLEKMSEIKQLINNIEKKTSSTLETKLIRELQEKNKKITLIAHIIVLLLQYFVAMWLMF